MCCEYINKVNEIDSNSDNTNITDVLLKCIMRRDQLYGYMNECKYMLQILCICNMLGCIIFMICEFENEINLLYRNFKYMLNQFKCTLYDQINLLYQNLPHIIVIFMTYSTLLISLVLTLYGLQQFQICFTFCILLLSYSRYVKKIFKKMKNQTIETKVKTLGIFKIYIYLLVLNSNLFIIYSFYGLCNQISIYRQKIKNI